MTEQDKDVYEFDMKQHAMVVAFPFCQVEDTGKDFVGPPVFVMNVPEGHDPGGHMEAALLFALAVVRNGQYKVHGLSNPIPDDLSTLEDPR
jgi:hypothetical protein